MEIRFFQCVNTRFEGLLYVGCKEEIREMISH